MEETQFINTYPYLATKKPKPHTVKDEAGISAMAPLTAKSAVKVEESTEEPEWESESAAVVMVADMEEEEVKGTSVAM
jgi:hypothetical protein